MCTTFYGLHKRRIGLQSCCFVKDSKNVLLFLWCSTDYRVTVKGSLPLFLCMQNNRQSVSLCLDVLQIKLLILDTPLSVHVRTLIDTLQANSPFTVSVRLYVVWWLTIWHKEAYQKEMFFFFKECVSILQNSACLFYFIAHLSIYLSSA